MGNVLIGGEVSNSASQLDVFARDISERLVSAGFKFEAEQEFLFNHKRYTLVMGRKYGVIHMVITQEGIKFESNAAVSMVVENANEQELYGYYSYRYLDGMLALCYHQRIVCKDTVEHTEFWGHELERMFRNLEKLTLELED